MAELTNKNGKGTPRVDLTPMVDLGFLLITFFMFTTTMSDKKALELQMPFQPETTETIKPSVVKNSTAMTVLLGADHLLYYYFGGTEDAKPVLKKAGFESGENSIRKIINQKQQLVQAMIASGALAIDDNFTLIIKATDEATTDDLVQMLDEININKVKVYSVAEITEQELLWLKELKS